MLWGNVLKVCFENDTLVCPGCGENNLHHEAVTVFERQKEDGESYALVMFKGAVSPAGGGGNPSARQNGVVVRFWCESCEATPELMLAQHKGATLVGWQPNPGKRDPSSDEDVHYFPNARKVS